jgi:hypothetical protein
LTPKEKDALREGDTVTVRGTIVVNESASGRVVAVDFGGSAVSKRSPFGDRVKLRGSLSVETKLAWISVDGTTMLVTKLWREIARID